MRKVLFFLLLFPIVSLWCQTPYTINYNIENGLPSDEIYDIISDDDHNIWISTDRGIAKYDGYNFEVFTTKEGLADNTNFYLIKGNGGEIWASGFNRELSIIQDGSITPFKLNDDLAKELIPKSYSWVKEIIEFDGRKFFIPFKTKNSKTLMVYELVNDQIHDVTSDSIFSLVDHTSDKMLTEINSEYYNIYMEKLLKVEFYYNISKAIKVNHGNILCHNLKSIYLRNSKFEIINKFDFSSRVEKIFFDKGKNLWVCTRKGLYFFKGTNLEIKPKILFENLLVSTIAQDFQGDIWVGTNDGGIKVIPEIEIENVLNISGSILNISEFQNKLVFGTTKSSLGVIGKDDDFQLFKIPSRRANMQIGQIEKWGNNKLSLAAGFLFDGYKFKIIGNTFTDNVFISTLTVKLKNDDLFIINGNIGFSVYDNESNKYGNFSTGSIIPVQEAITSIFQDSTNRIWLGTRTGIYIIDNYDYQNCYKYSIQDVTKLGRVSSISSDSNNEIWVTTIGNGAYAIKDDKAFYINDHVELSSNMVNQALSVNDSILFLATNSGIDVLQYKWTDTLAVKFVRNINVSDGLISNYVNDIEYWNGYIWAATNSGLCRFKPNIVNNAVPQIPISITHFENQDSSYHVNKDLDFKFDQNDVHISYSGLSFKQQNDQIQYKYRLIRNNDTNHNPWYYTNVRNQRFNNLVPGDYVFEVNAENALRIWNDEPATIRFCIHPHFTQTVAFRVIIILLLLLLAYLVYRAQINRLKRIQESENELIEAKRKVQESELDAIRNQMNPHFVYNSLNSIQNLIFKNDKEGANYYLSKFSSLMRQSLQFTQLNFIDLEKEIQFLINYIELESLRFPEKFIAKYEIDEAIQANEVLIPSLILQPIVENSIKHGFNNIDYQGIITIKVDLIDMKFISISVRDNGKGSLSTTKSSSEWTGKHKSLGVDLVRNRINLLNQSEFEENASMKEDITESGYQTIIKLPYKRHSI